LSREIAGIDHPYFAGSIERERTEYGLTEAQMNLGISMSQTN
jgi:hypothetical protein